MTTVEVGIREFLRDNYLFDENASWAFAVSDSFLDRGILDSQGMMELVNFVEQRWSLAVADDELVPENFDSISAIDCYIAHKLSKQKDG